MVIQTTSTRPPKLTGPWPITSCYVYIELSAQHVALTAGNGYAGGDQKGLPVQEDPPLTVDQLVSITVEIAGQIRR